MTPTLSLVEAAPLSTKARQILITAIEMFNRDGVARTSTNKVAYALGMSSGNLHYHFRSKSDVLVASYSLIERELIDAMTLQPGEISPAAAFATQKRVFGTLWRYRFFFGSMEVVLAESSTVFERYMEFQNWVVARIEATLLQAIEQGLHRPIVAPNTATQIAANSWMFWTGWIRWEMIAANNNPDGETADSAALLRVIRHHLSFQQPHYAPEFGIELERLIDAEERLVSASN